MTTEALARPRAGGSYRRLIALTVLFAGAVALYVVTIAPMILGTADRGWRQLQCRIVSSRVAAGEGGRYRPAIEYTYTVAGVSYRSDRFDFRARSWMTAAEAREVVLLYPEDRPALCYANPLDFKEAVLWPYDSPANLRDGLVILLFMIPALIVLLKGRRRTVVQVPTERPAAPGAAKWPPTLPGGPPKPVPVALPEAPRGERPASRLPLPVSLSAPAASPFPFGIEMPEDVFSPVDMGPRRSLGRMLLYLFNPRPTLTLSPRVPATGETTFLQWRFSSGGAGVRQLRIVLRGSQSARHRNGAGWSIDSDVFAEQTLLDSSEPNEIAGGSKSFTIPANTMPSFVAPHHEITWEIEVAADVRFWPDSTDRFRILVRPGKSRG